MALLWDVVKFVIYSFLLLILGFGMGVQAHVESKREQVLVIEDCRGEYEDISDIDGIIFERMPEGESY